MKRRQRLWIAILLLFLAPFVGYVVAYVGGGGDDTRATGEAPPAPRLIRKSVLSEPVAVEPFALIDDRGRRFDAAAFEGKWTFLLFGYTHCPDVCPFTLTNLAHIRQAMTANLRAESIPQFVFVSVDPDRDTAEELGGYISYFDPGFLAVTGSRAEIDRFVEAVGGFYRLERKDADGAYAVTHSAEIFVFDPRARHYATLQPPFDPKDMVDRFRALTAHFAAADGAQS